MDYVVQFYHLYTIFYSFCLFERLNFHFDVNSHRIKIDKHGTIFFQGSNDLTPFFVMAFPLFEAY